MPLSKDLISYGMPGILANAISSETVTGVPARSIVTSVTATGTSITDAFQLASLSVIFTTVGIGTGAKLSTPLINDAIGAGLFVKNAGANALLVYPDTALNTLNRGAAGVPFSLAAGTSAIFRASSLTNWES